MAGAVKLEGGGLAGGRRGRCTATVALSRSAVSSWILALSALDSLCSRPCSNTIQLTCLDILQPSHSFEISYQTQDSGLRQGDSRHGYSGVGLRFTPTWFKASTRAQGLDSGCFLSTHT